MRKGFLKEGSSRENRPINLSTDEVSCHVWFLWCLKKITKKKQNRESLNSFHLRSLTLTSNSWFSQELVLQLIKKFSQNTVVSFLLDPNQIANSLPSKIPNDIFLRTMFFVWIKLLIYNDHSDGSSLRPRLSQCCLMWKALFCVFKYFFNAYQSIMYRKLVVYS